MAEDFNSDLEDLENIEEEDIEAQMAEQERIAFEMEEKELKVKLTQILQRISGGSATLKFGERRTMKRAKAHPNLKGQIKRIQMLLLANKGKKIVQLLSSSPVLFWVLIGVLILILIIVVVAAIASIIPGLVPDDGGGEGGVGSPFGVNGSDFYGVRMVYKDELQASQQIVEDYIYIVEKGIDVADDVTQVSVSGTTYQLELNIDIMVPEDYDYSSFEENAFKQEYAELYSIIFDIAKVVYLEDNDVEYSGTSLIECVEGVKYFGYADIDEINTILKTNLLTEENIVITAKDSSGAEVTDTTILSEIEENVKGQAETKFDAEFVETNLKYTNRIEKLFVKDFIFENEDETVSGVTKENYVAMIFMPKNNVTFNQFSFVVSGANLNDIQVSLKNNGNEIELIKSDNMGDETNQSYIYNSNENLNLDVETFADVDVNNLQALSNDTSLFEILKNADVDSSIYLEQAEIEGLTYFTIKQNGVVVNVNNSEEFILTEFETLWE